MSSSIGQGFLEGTKYQHLDPSDQQRGVPQPPLHRLLREGKSIPLPVPARSLGDLTLREAVERRRSLRTYAETPLSHEELSFLLWCTQGVRPESKEAFTLRTVPSAGARHALETVLMINRVRDLTPGVYQYNAISHGLIQWEDQENAVEDWTNACLRQPMVRTSAVTFAWIADWSRMAWRYGERGMRYLFLDAGHVCQNLHLAAESVDSGACAIGAFDDDEIHRVLGLNGIDCFVVYLASVGKRVD